MKKTHSPRPSTRPYRRPVRSLSPARRRRRRAGILALVLILLVVGGSAAFGGWALWRQVRIGYVFSAPQRGPVVTVVVPDGASLGQIADILATRHIVPRAGAFQSRAEHDGYAAEFQPGTYSLHEYESYATIIAKLTAAQRVTRVVIPEGFTIAQIGAAAARRVRGFSAAAYREVTVSKPLSPDLGGYPKGASLEGLMFPAAYDFPPLKTARDLAELQLKTLHRNLAQLDTQRARKANLTDYDIVTIASIIEREVSVPSERSLVAAVIWNRLRVHMALQMDSIVAYGRHRSGASLTAKDFTIDTPYNVYLHKGLPPTPISNPGLATLRAATNPARVSYLYFVARNDGTSRHYFANTYEQFLKDKAKAGL